MYICVLTLHVDMTSDGIQLTSQKNRDRSLGWEVCHLACSLDPPHHTLWMRANEDVLVTYNWLNDIVHSLTGSATTPMSIGLVKYTGQ